MRVLFVSHYAGRTGAPMVLLAFQRWLKARGQVEFSTVFGAGGAMWADFAAVGPVVESPIAPGARLSPGWTLVRRLVGLRRWPGVAARLGVGLRVAREADVILANTSVAAPEIVRLAAAGRPVVWYFQEMRQVMEATPGLAMIRAVLPRCRRVVAGAEATWQLLRDELGVAEDRLDYVPCFTRLRRWTEPEAAAARREFRERQGWGRDDVVIGGCGVLGWRKGTDLFVQAARDLVARGSGTNVRFAWVGAGDESVREELERQVRQAGLGERCRFVGEVDDAAALMPAFDVLAVPSREEPQGLVMFEAAAAGVPMVGFAGSGGPARFAGAGGGLAAPHLDVPAFAGALERLVVDAHLRRTTGTRARELAMGEYDVEVQGPRLWSILERAADPTAGRTS